MKQLLHPHLQLPTLANFRVLVKLDFYEITNQRDHGTQVLTEFAEVFDGLFISCLSYFRVLQSITLFIYFAVYIELRAAQKVLAFLCSNSFICSLLQRIRKGG